MMRPWQHDAAGVLLRVRLTPKGGRDGLDGVETLADGAVVVKARVRAAPVEGEANDALVRLVAKTLKVRPSAVRIEAGHTARLKTLRIEGDGPMLALTLAEVTDYE
jgi:uncharacterized protein (TIGR00251 family)